MYEHPLHKKFLCQHCGGSFRTRQGLSGHIQFKHHAKTESQKIADNHILNKAIELKTAGSHMGLSKEDTAAWVKILVYWGRVQILSKYVGIELKPQDFKIYLLASLAQLYHQSEPTANS
jgi:hypothetical protein